jgi:hypothetical protein
MKTKLTKLSNVRRKALIDSCCWYALLTRDDSYQDRSKNIGEALEQIPCWVIPWPIMYETLCTRLVGDPSAIVQFDKVLKTTKTLRLDDHPYRDKALTNTFDIRKPHPNKISLVDSLLRLILDDQTNQIDCLFTFNSRDFMDVCIRRNIQIFDGVK